MKIICFGDSLTRGVSFVKGRVRIIKDNYPAFLEKLFSVNNPEDTIVLNKGVFNDNSDLLMKRLEKDVLSEKPNYVLLNVGGNDCNFKWQEVAENPDKNHDPIVPISQYIENIGQEPVRPAAGDDLRQHQGIIVHADGSHTLPSVSCATRMSVIAHWSPVSAA